MGGPGSGSRSIVNYEEIPFATDRVLYTKQPNESEPAWIAFMTYRDMDQRTIQKVCDKLKKSRMLVGRWVKKWRWRERAEAWDMYKDEERRRAELDEIADMKRRHVQLAQGMQQLGALELQRLLEAARAKKKDGAGLTPQDVQKLIDAGAKLERITRGEPGGDEQSQVVQVQMITIGGTRIKF